jgi:hypothetical protein
LSCGGNVIISLITPDPKRAHLCINSKDVDLSLEEVIQKQKKDGELAQPNLRRNRRRGIKKSHRRLVEETRSLDEILERRNLRELFRASVRGLALPKNSLVLTIKKIELIFKVETRLLGLSSKNWMGIDRSHRWRFEYRLKNITGKKSGNQSIMSHAPSCRRFLLVNT